MRANASRGGTRGLAIEPGFTLLELLVVIAIVAILAALLQTAYSRSVQAGKAAACTANLRQIGMALNVYLGENEMTFPALQNRANVQDDVPALDTFFLKYVQNPAVFACPADNLKLAKTSGTSYYWTTALNGQHVASLSLLNLTEDHSRIPIIADKQGFHPYLNDKVNILYADGHATKDLKFW